MNLEIKKLKPDVKVSKANDVDAGLDLYVSSVTETHSYIEYGTGIAVNIPAGFVGLLFPRSSISKTDLSMANSVGVIDSGYHGEVKARMRHHGNAIETYKLGNKFVQLVVLPLALYEVKFVEAFSNTSARGTDGFGSTGG